MDREVEANRRRVSARDRRRQRSRRRRVGAVAAVGVVLAGCGLFDDEASGRVVILGDSITFASAEELQERFAERDDELELDARPGYTAEEVLEEARTVADELGDTGAAQVIINVGTNDVMRGYEPDRTLVAVTQMVDLFPGAACVHLVTVGRQILNYEDPGLTDRIDAVNALLEELTDDRSEVRILDWNAVLADPPEDHEIGDLLAGDTVHTSPLGETVLADLYIEALDACA